jgi:hypothetical protein
MPYRSSEIPDRNLLTDPVGELFKISMEMQSHAMQTRRAVVGKEMTDTGGYRGVVTAVDAKTVHLRAADGAKRSVALTGKCLSQVLQLSSPRQVPSSHRAAGKAAGPLDATTRK